jgi:hypothetical protein
VRAAGGDPPAPCITTAAASPDWNALKELGGGPALVSSTRSRLDGEWATGSEGGSHPASNDEFTGICATSPTELERALGLGAPLPSLAPTRTAVSSDTATRRPPAAAALAPSAAHAPMRLHLSVEWTRLATEATNHGPARRPGAVRPVPHGGVAGPQRHTAGAAGDGHRVLVGDGGGDHHCGRP